MYNFYLYIYNIYTPGTWNIHVWKSCFNWMKSQIFTWEMVVSQFPSIINCLFRVPGICIHIIYIHCPIIHFCNLPTLHHSPTKNTMWDLESPLEKEKSCCIFGPFTGIIQDSFKPLMKPLNFILRRQRLFWVEKLVVDEYVLGYLLTWWVS